MNPYLILNVGQDADNDRIRKSYLRAIKQSPPETHPEAFGMISEAYEQIKDETSRHRHFLFGHSLAGGSPLDTFIRYSRARDAFKPMSSERLKSYLRACAES